MPVRPVPAMPVRPVPATPLTVTVLVLGSSGPPIGTLRAALDTVDRVAWRVLAGAAPAGTTAVDIVLCDGPVRAATAARRWPGAAIVALVPGRHRGTVDGPDPAPVLYLPGGDIGLIAAYVRSIARRRGLTAEDTGR